MVRMAQPFSLRYMLVDGQGNFGSVDGDSAGGDALHRSAHGASLAHELLRDIDKDTVDFSRTTTRRNWNRRCCRRVVPNLLINGSSGIAVGMATNIPPHNSAKSSTPRSRVIDDPEISIEELMQHMPGPDFPTAGIINGSSGIIEAYRTGRGRILVRGKADIETDGNGREAIIVTELPYR